MSKAVIPVSGGLDSAVILSMVSAQHDDIYAITFDYGQKHRKEIQFAGFQLINYDNIEEHKILDIQFFKKIANTSSLTNNNIKVAHAKDVLGDAQTVNYVPFRNMMMLSIACSYAEAVGAETVYHGSALVDSQAGYWDGSIEFLEQINNLTALNRKNRIKIEAPLLQLSKKEIINIGLDNGVRFEDTWTCYEGKELACGYCTACSSRIQGFLDNDAMKDPIEYERTDIPWGVRLF
jgi:7-cyano-7-deazaguanine synthase